MKKFALLIIACLEAFNIAVAQITSQQADALVTNQIYDTIIEYVDIYSFPELLHRNDSIQLFDGTIIFVPYNNCYGYFIDLLPFANWSHPCQYCFVNNGGDYMIIDKQDWPEIWEELDFVSLMQRPTFIDYEFVCDSVQHRNIAEPDPHLWAVLICADPGANKKRFWGDLSCVYTTLTNAYGFMENTSSDEYNSHIIVMAPNSVTDIAFQDGFYNLNGSDGPYDYMDFYSNYYDNSYSPNGLRDIFSSFGSQGSRKLGPDDKLFIYITGHGENDNGTSGFTMKWQKPNNEYVSETVDAARLSDWLLDIDCSQITLMMQNCYSGGFIKYFMNVADDEVKCKNRSVITATTEDGLSWPDLHLTPNGGIFSEYNDISNVNEFTYFWSAASLGYYPYCHIDIDNHLQNFHGPWEGVGYGRVGQNEMDEIWDSHYQHDHFPIIDNYDINPDADQDGVLSFNESFLFARNIDTWCDEAGYYEPYNFDPDLNWNNYLQFLRHGGDKPRASFESTFTSEAITLRGYEGQVDGLGVNSGTATQPYRLCGDLWVGPDSDLTMWDDIYSPEDVKIYIEPTGMLTMDGCTFDKLPETDRGMWQGVQVWGNFNESQMPEHGKYKQGYLKMKNDATIKNSRCAVELWHSGDWNSMGGIIHATNAHFINNTKAIHALNYRNMVNGNECDYLAQFRNCEFNVGDGYIGSPDALFYKHVDLANVRGVRFYGCDFSLKCVNHNISDWTDGIAAYNAGFSVSGYTQGLNHKPSTFDGFFNGVQALNDGTITRSFSVKNSDFTNNDYGIFGRAADVPVILNNTFSIGLDNWYSCSAAIQLEGIGNFVVEGNSIMKAPDCTNDNFGIIIKDSQTEGNQVHLNDLDGLYCGNLAWGDNFGNIDLGLEYYCNSNADNAFDFYVKYENPDTDIQLEQGDLDYDPHNTFSDGHNLISNFYNDGEHIVDYHFVANSSDGLELYRVRDAKANALYDCQPHYGGGGNAHNGSSTPVLSAAQKQQRQTDYANALNTYNSVKNVYDRLTDGGSTNSTVADIRSAMPSDMWELRSKLLGSSPYLSEEVLKETADRDDVFTESILFEILASNPDELRKGDIIKYVEDKEHPLPEYMVDILRQLSTGTTTNKTLLLNSMASSRHDYRQAAADMVRSILADSIVDMAELRGWLANLNDLSADRQIISTYMAEGDFGTAFSLANMLPALYEFDETALAEHDDYMELLGLYRDLHNDGRSTLQLTESETDDVEDIAINGTGLPQYMAQSLLEATTERYHFAECPLIDEPSGMGRGVPQGYTQEDLSKAMGLAVSAKPNPATTWVAIDFNLPGDAKTAVVEIVNSLGEKVMLSQLNGNVGQKVLDLRELAGGVYTITILCGEYYLTEKLIVTK